MLNEEVDYGVIKVTKDKDVSKVILGWVEGLVLVTVMMIVIVEVVGEVMVIIDIVDNQYTARRVHGGRGGMGEKNKLLHISILQVYLFFFKLPTLTSH